MGDETDVFDLPYHEGSGNPDVGHMSQSRQILVDNAQQHLTETINEFYEGGMSFVQLEHNLEQLGYSHDRVVHLATATHMEYVYRNSHHGEPSGLTFNQLNYLQSGPGFDISRTNVHRDISGRVYVDDYRVRDDAGNPSRLFLPPPERIDPLTAEQREEFDYLSQVQRDITITPASLTGEQIQLSQLQRENVMRLATEYLNSDPRFRQSARAEFRNNVQNIDGLENVDNIEEDLFELFVDIDDEYDYRQQNNGLPRGLDQTQYDFLRSHQSRLGYSGQPILREPESEVLYFYSFNNLGKTPIPSDTQIEQYNSNVPSYIDLDVRPTNENYNDLNIVLADYLRNDINKDGAISRIQALTQYDPNSRLSDPYRADMYNEFIFTLNSQEREHDYRILNNGRPSQLSELQYVYLMNHTIRDDREERYNGQVIIVDNTGDLSYRMTTGINMGIPSDEYIRGFIEQGLYTPPSRVEPSVSPDDEEEEVDYRVNRIIAVIGARRYDQLTQEQRKWSAKRKRKINCKRPKGFSERAHCAAKKRRSGKG
jgi:hypothetical protein